MRWWTRLHGAVLLPGLLVAVLTAGCVFSASSGGDDAEDGADYPARTHPDSTLAKLVRAYRDMDAEAYLDCLSDSLVFHLNEDLLGVDPELPETWGRAAETALHEYMFSDTSDVESIELTLTQFGDPEEIPAQRHPDSSMYRYRKNVNLWVHMSGWLTYWANCGGEFVLQIDPDETGPWGEPLWEVVEWHDVDQHTGATREECTWSDVKALFLRASGWPVLDRASDGSGVKTARKPAPE